MMHAEEPVGRLAPSPTGRLHVGHARSFLLAWWSARSQGGRVLLRVEDIDRARARQALVDDALRDLEWLGLDWDGAALYQSADDAPYAAALETLLDSGRACACVGARRASAAGQSAPHASDGELPYPGTCRDRFAHVAEAEASCGSSAGVRLRVAPGAVVVEDELRGSKSFDVAAEVGDFLLARRDGVWAYQLAVVVDDARQGVSEVVRGDDLWSSAARQALLQDALELPRPRWSHVPLVVDAQGRRLAKRDADLSLTSLREAGVDARALVAWVAQRIGLSREPRCDARELLDGFELAKIPLEPVVFDEEERARLWSTRSRVG